MRSAFFDRAGAVFINLLLLASLSFAGTEQEQPERFDVLAGFVPIDDGSLHVVVLAADRAPMTYCGGGWNFGLIQTGTLDPRGVVITDPTGCWLASGTNPEKDIITFRYMSIHDGVIREFKIGAGKMRRMIYEWRTQRLYPI